MDRKLTKRGSERREQILVAASRLFAEQGYHGTKNVGLFALKRCWTLGTICEIQ